MKNENNDVPVTLIQNEDSFGVSGKKKMYTKNQIDIAAFFGTFIAAAYLLRKNYQLIGEETKASSIMYYAVAIIVFVFVVLMLLPESISSGTSGVMFGIIYVSMAEYVYRTNQKEIVEKIFSEGRERKSGWNVFGVILVSLLVTLILLFALVVLVSMLGL